MSSVRHPDHETRVVEGTAKNIIVLNKKISERYNIMERKIWTQIEINANEGEYRRFVAENLATTGRQPEPPMTIQPENEQKSAANQGPGPAGQRKKKRTKKKKRSGKPRNRGRSYGLVRMPKYKRPEKKDPEEPST